MFSCKFCDTFENKSFTEQLLTTAYDISSLIGFLLFGCCCFFLIFDEAIRLQQIRYSKEILHQNFSGNPE